MNNGLVSLFWIVQSRKASNQPVTSITQRSGKPGVSHINPMASTPTTTAVQPIRRGHGLAEDATPEGAAT